MDSTKKNRVLRIARGTSLSGNLLMAMGVAKTPDIRAGLIEQGLISSPDHMAPLVWILESSGHVTRMEALLVEDLERESTRVLRAWRMGMAAAALDWVTEDEVRSLAARLRAGELANADEPLVDAGLLEGWQMRMVEDMERRVELEKLKSGRTPDAEDFDLESREEWRIGSGPQSDIRVVDTSVSLAHARLVKCDGEWFVEDLGSETGTSVDGSPVRDRSPLLTGSTVVVGNAAIRLVDPVAPPRHVPSPVAAAAANANDERLAVRILAASALSAALIFGVWRFMPSHTTSASAGSLPVVAQESEAEEPMETAAEEPEASVVTAESHPAAPVHAQLTDLDRGLTPIADPPEARVAEAAPKALAPEALAKLARTGSEEERRRAIEELSQKDGKWPAESIRIMLEWRAASTRELSRPAEIKTAERVRALRQTLLDLREKAIRLVQSDAYTAEKGQPEVDAAIQAIRNFLGDARKIAAPKLTRAQLDSFERVDWLDRHLAALGNTTPVEALHPSIALRQTEALNVERYRLDSEPAEKDARDAETRKHNETCRELLSREEWAQMTALNDHRALLGRPLLRIDAALCRAAEARCTALEKAGSGKAPDLEAAAGLARDHGYRGKTAQSIHRRVASGRRAHESWTHFAPDHRNLLRVYFHDAGVAQVGGSWTLVLGRSK